MNNIANKKNQYARLKIDVTILERNAATDVITTSDKAVYENDKEWIEWEE